MKKSICLLLALGVIAALVPVGMAAAKKPAPKLEGITEYFLVLDLTDPEKIDAEGRALVWEGTISGDIEGVIQWWVPWPPSTHYDDRCVILDEAKENVLLDVLESGSTTYRDDKDPIWRTNGVVVDASGKYTAWIGRQTHADGDAKMLEMPPCGTGTFRVN
jgi:hypothetical protein